MLEVDTPALVRHAVTDRHIHSAQVQLPGQPAPLFLHTSPEYAMKRLLAAGSGDIYQIAHVFRGEREQPAAQRRIHADRVVSLRLSMRELMHEVAELARTLLDLPPDAPIETLTLCGRRSSASSAAIRSAPAMRQLRASGDSRMRLERAGRRAAATAMSCSTGSWAAPSARAWAPTGLCFVHHYPASQAALARLDRS